MVIHLLSYRILFIICVQMLRVLEQSGQSFYRYMLLDNLVWVTPLKRECFSFLLLLFCCIWLLPFIHLYWMDIMPASSAFTIYVDLAVQAPVSDREYNATLPQTASMIDLAFKMINEGKGLELMPRDASPDVPITAYR